MREAEFWFTLGQLMGMFSTSDVQVLLQDLGYSDDEYKKLEKGLLHLARFAYKGSDK